MPPTLAQRVKQALGKVHDRLERGDIAGARDEVQAGRALCEKEPRLVMAGLTEAKWVDLEAVVNTMPDAAVQVWQHRAPASALSLPLAPPSHPVSVAVHVLL